jgi:hypothetical protein
MANGTLLIQSYAARFSAPVADVNVIVTGDGFTKTLITDDTGTSTVITVPTPACQYSLEEDNSTVLPYATVTVVASKEGYRTVTIEGVQVFPDQLTQVTAEMVTSGGEAEDIPDTPTVIPTHALFTGTGGSGPAPIENCPGGGGGEVLDQVVVPTRITVHLGKPAASAQNVTVGFQEYIANVASSEVYPTWVERNYHANGQIYRIGHMACFS